MKKEQMIDDLIMQLDRSISNGVGHVNVKVENESIKLEKIDKNDETLVKEVETLGCTDCNCQNMPCSVPTLMEGLDYEEENEGGK